LVEHGTSDGVSDVFRAAICNDVFYHPKVVWEGEVAAGVHKDLAEFVVRDNILMVSPVQDNELPVFVVLVGSEGGSRWFFGSYFSVGIDENIAKEGAVPSSGNEASVIFCCDGKIIGSF
jgi:hypothetical protein